MRALLGHRAFVVLVFTMLLPLPLLGNPYTVFIGNLVLVYIIVALGLNILYGYTGQLAFANAAMFGIGAYGSGITQVQLGLPYWLALPFGAILAMLIGTLIVFPALRLKRLYLALATIAFAEFTRWVFIEWRSVTFGAGGFSIPPVDFEPLPVRSETGVYYLSWLLSAAALGLAWRLMRSHIGRAFVAIRDGEVAAAALGIDLVRYKALAFALSGLYAGLAGGLYSALLNFIAPPSFDLFQMIFHLVIIAVGGVGSLAGSVAGPAILVLVHEAIRGIQDFQEIVFGLILLVFVVFIPEGLMSLLKRYLPGWTEPLHGAPVAARSLGRPLTAKEPLLKD